MKWISALIWISAAASAFAADSEPAGVRKSVNQIIAYELRHDTTQRDEAFLAEFTPRLRAAIVKDMSGPELGLIDFGILCRCQTGTLKMRILAITGSKDAANVQIESSSRGNPGTITQTWHMRRNGQSWPISDIENSSDPSLLADLERTNR